MINQRKDPIMDSELYRNYLDILKQELVPALGCTEPIAIACAAAKARRLLGSFPESLEMKLSGNIIKNVKGDRKSTRLNSSHVSISYAVFCLKKKKKKKR